MSGVIREDSVTAREDIGRDVGYLGIKNIVRTTGNWGGSKPAAWGNFALPFLGEIYPDDMYNFWKENGNLKNDTFIKRR
ncbi:MAG: hypothetical protein RMJ51_03105 [Candidatus Calescibacterium sp.]|nr:hypothetical protein [Candidatus Calescibacterium sp.]MDW8195214.1 hypothetical protein [Candidatus Calescibacterium sp.]